MNKIIPWPGNMYFVCVSRKLLSNTNKMGYVPGSKFLHWGAPSAKHKSPPLYRIYHHDMFLCVSWKKQWDNPWGNSTAVGRACYAPSWSSRRKTEIFTPDLVCCLFILPQNHTSFLFVDFFAIFCCCYCLLLHRLHSSDTHYWLLLNRSLDTHTSLSRT